jgi:hypothetical protein
MAVLDHASSILDRADRSKQSHRETSLNTDFAYYLNVEDGNKTWQQRRPRPSERADGTRTVH